MKIFMTGGTGFVGTNLIQRLTQKGHGVTVLTRTIREGRPLPQGASYLQGNPTEEGAWQQGAAEHEAVINLAGSSIFRRWTNASKRDMVDSRVLTTQNLVKALSARKGKETLLISTSAVGYYGFHEEEELDEDSPPGDDFLATLAQDWETSALRAQGYGTRVVLLRSGIVMGSRGGALAQIVPVFNKYMGSPLGSGRQWFPWIHEEDLANIYLYILERKDISGPINCTSPNPVRNEEMTKILGEVLGKPTLMPAVPGFILKMMMGEFGSVLLKGQRVLPKRLLEMGFRFSFPDFREALKDLLR
jgi:uncharacterized protein (TIGR01777 family)